jgi:ligand-binding sensor domain-containing protein
MKFSLCTQVRRPESSLKDSAGLLRRWAPAEFLRLPSWFVSLSRHISAHVRHHPALAAGLALCLPWVGTASLRAENAAVNDLPFPLIERFENFGTRDGLPSHKVQCVLRASDGKLWAGTYGGAVVREDGRFRVLGTNVGLSHRMVTCLAEDPRTGDIWIGTMRGLNRYSAGRITTYLQTGSGLPNNVVYGLDIMDDTLWVATAAGLGALNLKTGSWSIYDQNNTVMHEPWVYAVKGAKDRVFVGVWGGGILEYEPANGIFKEHRDPDRDVHFELAHDAGPVADITSWIAWEDGILWQGTYFGLSRYDGSRWRTWQEKKSPLPSNFVNFIWAHGRVAWVATDRGLAATDGDTWVNYRTDANGAGIVEITRPNQAVRTRVLPTGLPNNFVLGIWADDQEAWLATSDGLAHATLSATRAVDAK